MMTLTKEDLAAIEGLFTGKFDGIDRQFESIDKRFEAMDQRFEAMDQRFEAMDQRFEAIDQRFEAMDWRFDAIDQRFDAIDMRLERMDGDISKLKVGQQLIKKDLYKISKQVEMTYDLALENWGQIEESKKRISVLEG